MSEHTVPMGLPDREYYDSKLAEIPTDFLRRSVEFLREYFSERDVEEIRRLHETEGEDWATPYHFTWGMGMRNRLREAGLRDDELPDKNWDDYYVAVVEIAAGIRPDPFQEPT